jgi:hypothetical protein
MMPRHALLLAATLVAVSAADAGAQVGAPPQCSDFAPLRQETEERGKAIKAASDRKAPATEACQLLGRYVAAESKLLKFMVDNQVWCGVPANAIEAIKTAHGRAQEMRQRVCQAAKAGPAPKPKLPSLGDALGSSNVATPSNTQTGRGTLDSLTGNPLAR